MSVMVISPQMIADVTKKAQTFRTYGFSHEEKMMSPTLATMNKDDICKNEENVIGFFWRLYRWNNYSYDLRYSRSFSRDTVLRMEFDNAQKMAKDIDIYQFEMILRFLLYNIENYEFVDSDTKKQMDKDVELLKSIREEVCYHIIDALQEEKGCEWYY